MQLVCGAIPLAFAVEQAGGAASTGTGRVLDLPITSIHQGVELDWHPGDVHGFEQQLGG